MSDIDNDNSANELTDRVSQLIVSSAPVEVVVVSADEHARDTAAVGQLISYGEDGEPVRPSWDDIVSLEEAPVAAEIDVGADLQTTDLDCDLGQEELDAPESSGESSDAADSQSDKGDASTTVAPVRCEPSSSQRTDPAGVDPSLTAGATDHASGPSGQTTSGADINVESKETPMESDYGEEEHPSRKRKRGARGGKKHRTSNIPADGERLSVLEKANPGEPESDKAQGPSGAPSLESVTSPLGPASKRVRLDKPGAAYKKKYAKDSIPKRSVARGLLSSMPLYAQGDLPAEEAAQYPAPDADGTWTCPLCPSDADFPYLSSFRMHYQRTQIPTKELLNIHVTAFHYPWVMVLKCAHCSDEFRAKQPSGKKAKGKTEKSSKTSDGEAEAAKVDRIPTFALWGHLEAHICLRHPAHLNEVRAAKTKGTGARYRTAAPEYNYGYIPPVLPPPEVLPSQSGNVNRTTVVGPWVLADTMLQDCNSSQRERGAPVDDSIAALAVRYFSSSKRKAGKTDADAVKSVRKVTPPVRRKAAQPKTVTKIVPSAMPGIVARQAKAQLHASNVVALESATAASRRILSEASGGARPKTTSTKTSGEQKALTHIVPSPVTTATAGAGFWTAPSPPRHLQAPPQITRAQIGCGVSATVTTPSPVAPQPVPRTKVPPGFASLPVGRALARYQVPQGNRAEELKAVLGDEVGALMRQNLDELQRAASVIPAPCRDADRPSGSAEGPDTASIASNLAGWSQHVHNIIERDLRQSSPFGHLGGPDARTAALALRNHVAEVRELQRVLDSHVRRATDTAAQLTFEDGILRGAAASVAQMREVVETVKREAYQEGFAAGQMAAAKASALPAKDSGLAREVAELTERVRVLTAENERLSAVIPGNAAVTSKQALFPFFVRFWGEHTTMKQRFDSAFELAMLLREHGITDIPSWVHQPETVPNLPPSNPLSPEIGPRGPR